MPFLYLIRWPYLIVNMCLESLSSLARLTLLLLYSDLPFLFYCFWFKVYSIWLSMTTLFSFRFCLHSISYSIPSFSVYMFSSFVVISLFLSYNLHLWSGDLLSLWFLAYYFWFVSYGSCFVVTLRLTQNIFWL